jgi:hypothetical protein
MGEKRVRGVHICIVDKGVLDPKQDDEREPCEDDFAGVWHGVPVLKLSTVVLRRLSHATGTGLVPVNIKPGGKKATLIACEGRDINYLNNVHPFRMSINIFLLITYYVSLTSQGTRG